MEDRNDRGYGNRDRGGYRENRGGNDRPSDEITFSKKVRAGKRTYFFDVKPTRASDYFICISESKKTFDGQFQKNKIFLYKEDFNKFMEAMNETVTHVKKELMPDYNFEEFDNRKEEGGGEYYNGDNTHKPDDFSDMQ